MERDNLRIENLRLSEREKQPAATGYRKRPGVLTGRTVASSVGCGPLYVTVNEDPNGQPFEIFFKLGKSGSCQGSYLEALGVAMSVGLRYGADPQKYIEKFRGMRCPNPKLRDSDGPGAHSCADGISNALERALQLLLIESEQPAPAVGDAASTVRPFIDLLTEPLPARPAKPIAASGVGLCPKCSGPLVYQSGCTVCLEQCGYVGTCG
jgi:ribonucleoside-diphosphate reductase alpha chain